MQMGIFSGLWQGVSTTIGQGIAFTQHVYDNKNGITQQNQQYNLQAQALTIEQQKQTQKIILIAGIAILLIVTVVLTLKKNKNAA